MNLQDVDLIQTQRTMKRIIYILFISLFLVQCTGDDDSVDCSNVLCRAPEFVFEFVDVNSGENVLEGIFNQEAPDDFLIMIPESETSLVFQQDYTLNNNNQLNVFRFSEQFQVALQNVFDVTITYDFEATSTGCCQSFSYNNIQVMGATFETIENEERLILRIFI